MIRSLFLLTFIFSSACAFSSKATVESPPAQVAQESRAHETRLEPEFPPLVIGHRGASGYRPEHTIESYTVAIEQGADYIEPDLVITKDNVLIARHENEISGTTDVADKFPKRKRTKIIDGNSVTGWFAEDFTLAEIKKLRARERLPERDHSYDGQFLVPTFQEVIALAKRKSAEAGRTIGIYPETKHPTYFKKIHRPLEPVLARDLKRAGLAEASSPVIIQSFEMGSLRTLRKLLPTKLVFLYGDPSVQPFDLKVANDQRTYGDLAKPESLANLSILLYGIGPDKRLIVPQGADGKLLPPTDLIAQAHAKGLRVHPYTFRSDKEFLAAEYNGDPLNEYRQFIELGVDGFFSDFPDTARKAAGPLIIND